MEKENKKVKEKLNTMTVKEFKEAIEKSPNLKKALKDLEKAVDKEFQD